MRDHRARVHAGVGSAGAVNANLLLKNFRDRFLHDLLHAEADLLDLPAGVVGPVVCDGELQAHGVNQLGRLSRNDCSKIAAAARSTFSLRSLRRMSVCNSMRFACAEVSRSSHVTIGTAIVSFSTATNSCTFAAAGP